MAMGFLLYILAFMVFYDLSIHIIYLLAKEDFFLKRKINYWPEWKGRKYDIFWTTYWGIAFILILTYLLVP